MAVNRRRPSRVYGFDNALQGINPQNIVATRAPTSLDLAEIGTNWINTSTDLPYTLTSVVAGSANWATSPSSGSTTLADLTVTTTADIGTDLTVGGTSGFTGAATFVDLSVSGVFAYGGSGAISWTTSVSQPNAIVLDATAGGIDILASGAAAGEDIDITATGSSVNISATEAVDAAISLQSSAGGIDIDGILQINIATSENTVDAIVINASAGGIDITAAGAATEDIDIVNTSGSININSGEVIADSMVLTSAGGLDFAVAGTGTLDIDMVNTSGSINITAGESAADSIVITSSIGGIDILAAGAAAGEDIDIVATGSSVNISSSENVANAITLTSSAGGIDITNTGTAGEDIDIASSGASVNISSSENAALAVFIEADGGINETIYVHSDQGTGAGSIHLESDVGGVTLTSGLASADAINFSASAGGVDLDGALEVNIASSEAAATAISLDASAGTGGITMAAGTGGILLGNQVDCTTIDVGDVAATASRTITIAGGTQVTAATTDLVDIAPDGATTNADSIKQVDVLTGVLTTGASTLNLNSGTAASGVHTTNVSTGTGGGTKAVNVGNADGLTTVNIDAITNINDDIDVATQINTGTSTGTVSIGNSLAGAVTVDSGAGISLDAAAASNFTTTGAGIDIDFVSTAGRVITTSGEDAADSIYLHANAGVAETIRLHSDLGTGTASVGLVSDVGGVTLTGGLVGDAVNLTATSGSAIVTAGEAVIDAIQLTTTNAAGGITATTGAVAATTGLHVKQGAISAGIYVGSGAPAHNAPKGSLYLRSDGSGVADRIYVATDAAGTWTAISTVA